MTEEQEVIKYIEKRIKVCNENADICDDNDFDEEATYLREESYMLEKVLNMLKEKDKEIEFQKDIRNTEKNRHKKTEKSLKGIINKQNTELAEKNAEIEKKDKIIDLMAEEIKERKYVFTNKTKKDIKQYFERKSENEN